MKRFKYILIAVSLIVVLVGSVMVFATEENIVETTNLLDFPETYESTVLQRYGDTRYIAVSGNNTLAHDWAYCVQKGAATYDRYDRDGLEYYSRYHDVALFIKIKGNIAQWYKFTKGTKSGTKTERKMVRIRGE